LIRDLFNPSSWPIIFIHGVERKIKGLKVFVKPYIVKLKVGEQTKIIEILKYLVI